MASHVVAIEEEQTSSYGQTTGQFTSVPMPQEEQEVVDAASAAKKLFKLNLLPCKVLCLVLVLLVCIGWVAIIGLLIVKEEWQLVMVAWLLLYCGIHFMVWYCRRHSTSGSQGATLRQRLMARLRGTELVVVSSTGGPDAPPSYEEIVKSELPPPTYHSVVNETGVSRFSRVMNNMPLLPWFIKKKTLEQSASLDKTNCDVVVLSGAVDVEGHNTSSMTTSSNMGESSSSSAEDDWKSSVIVCDVPSLALDDDDEPIDLPSYDALIRESAVMTPIHQALSGLPRPPPYSRTPMENIAEDQQQQHQQQNE